MRWAGISFRAQGPRGKVHSNPRCVETQLQDSKTQDGSGVEASWTSGGGGRTRTTGPQCQAGSDEVMTGIDATITAESGVIERYGSSENDQYEDTQRCEWVIAPSNGKAVKLKFTEFDLEWNYDWVKVYDCKSIDSTRCKLLGWFTGQECDSATETEWKRFSILIGCKPINRLTGGSMLNRHYLAPRGVMKVQFKSDWKMAGRGFKASYWTTDFVPLAPIPNYCDNEGSGGELLYPNALPPGTPQIVRDWTRGPSGNFTDGSEGLNYLHGMSCRWLIQPYENPSMWSWNTIPTVLQSHKIVQLFFTEFSTEARYDEVDPYYQETNASFPTRLTAGVSGIMGDVSGQYTGAMAENRVWRVETGLMEARFATDETITRPGFVGVWTTFPYCFGVQYFHDKDEASLTDGSPEGETYIGGMSCTFAIAHRDAPAGISLSVEKFSVRSQDTLKIWECVLRTPYFGSDLHAGCEILATLTGGTGNGWTGWTINSTYDKVLVEFVSASSNPSMQDTSGFKVNYKIREAVCGNGVLEGTWHPRGEKCDPPDGINCGWGCIKIPSRCGNGIVQAGEECDSSSVSKCTGTCLCQNGYEGADCFDEDECSATTLNNCDSNADCDNSDGSFTCACKTGFTGNGVTCQDINECSETTATNCGTNAKCFNTPGSFTCDCNVGYLGDGMSCADYNECDAPENNNCDANAVCANTPGSFTCSCDEGYSTTDDGVTCADIHECNANPDSCGTNEECTNTPGSFTCACAVGYVSDGTSCADHNECGAPDDNNCATNAECTNTPGSFTCSCDQGYSTTDDGVTCPDANECAVPGSHHCDGDGATCLNTDGSFTCVCNVGFSPTANSWWEGKCFFEGSDGGSVSPAPEEIDYQLSPAANLASSGAVPVTQKNVIFVCKVQFPSTPQDAVLFEFGATGWGLWVGVNGGKFQIQAGIGNVKVEAGGSYPETTYLITDSFPKDGEVHTVIVDLQWLQEARIRLWFDTWYAGEGQRMEQGTISMWAGSDPGTYGVAAGNVALHVAKTAWPGEIVSDLLVYSDSARVDSCITDCVPADTFGSSTGSGSGSESGSGAPGYLGGLAGVGSVFAVWYYMRRKQQPAREERQPRRQSGGQDVELVIIEDGVRVGSIEVLPDLPTVLGRDAEPPLQLAHESCSRTHAQLLLKLDGERPVLTIEDLGSSNGTRLDGMQIPPRVPVEVHGGNNITFGSHQRVFLVVGLPVSDEEAMQDAPGGNTSVLASVLAHLGYPRENPPTVSTVIPPIETQSLLRREASVVSDASSATREVVPIETQGMLRREASVVSDASSAPHGVVLDIQV